MVDFQQVSIHFRNAIEGSGFLLVGLILLVLLAPAGWALFKDRLALQKRNSSLQDQMRGAGLTAADRRLVLRAIQEISPANPDALLQDPRIFNRWVDGLEGIQSPSPQLVEQLTRIRQGLYSSIYVVPPLRSTRDFQPNLVVNVCLAKGATALLPAVLVEQDDGQLTFRLTRKEVVFPYRIEDRLLLHVPHPEAMYIAPVRVLALSSDQRQITVSHTPPREFQVRQYREFWRVDLEMPVRFQAITRNGEAEAALPGNRDGKLINLSGGGAALLCEGPLPCFVRAPCPGASICAFRFTWRTGCSTRWWPG